MSMPNIKNAKVVYYSGTGNARKVAECFVDILNDKSVKAHAFALKAGNTYQEEKEDVLILVYAVHAFNAPAAVYNWIKDLPSGEGKKVTVVSVSAGGERFPNTACRINCIKRLEKKGYNVTYEKMLVMLCNWVVATKSALACKILEVLPSKVTYIVDDILAGVRRRTKANLIERGISFVFEIEKVGARKFGKRIKCNSNCNGCGWCSNNCPSGNIRLENGRPVFADKCHMCLSCLYGCPQKALSPGMMKFVIIKDGFSLNALEQNLPSSIEPANIEELTKGFKWSGLRKYLLEDDF